MRASWYALGRGGWRDYVTLLHVPYTLWHLSYVVIGGCLAERTAWGRLGLTLIAFFLAMGIAAHALDELHGRPLGSDIASAVLISLAAASLAIACAIGVVVAVDFSLWLLPLVAVGAFLVVAYNLELAQGRFHTDLCFGLAWGAFPVLTAYLAVSGQVRAETILAAAAATLLSLAQRTLSTSVRRVRRRVTKVSGSLTFNDGSHGTIDSQLLVAAPERALRLLTAAPILFAGALVALRVSA